MAPGQSLLDWEQQQMDRLVAERAVPRVGIGLLPVGGDVDGLADRRLVGVEVARHLAERDDHEELVDRAVQRGAILAHDPEARDLGAQILDQLGVAVHARSS